MPETPMPETPETSGGEVEHEVFLFSNLILLVIFVFLQHMPHLVLSIKLE